MHYAHSEFITEKGSAAASSIYTSYLPKLAFENRTGSWYWSSDGYQFPPSVWFHYHKSHRLARIGFRTIRSNSSRYRASKSFQVIGSNDCHDWTILLEVDDGGFTFDNEFRSWDIPIDNRCSFTCIGLRGTTPKIPGNEKTYMAVRNIIMWDEHE